MYRVLLVDDHEIVRRGIRSILEDRFSGITIREASDGEGALAALEPVPDVILLDLGLPGRGGIELLAEIKHRLPRVPVLVISLFSEEQFALRALRVGASGYLNKAAAPEHLVVALERVVRGGRYISDAVAERLASKLVDGAGAPHEALSDREFEVMRGLANGESVGEIAARMCLSPKTVSTYRARVLDKMGLETNAELMRYALDNSLV